MYVLYDRPFLALLAKGQTSYRDGAASGVRPSVRRLSSVRRQHLLVSALTQTNII